MAIGWVVGCGRFHYELLDPDAGGTGGTSGGMLRDAGVLVWNGDAAALAGATGSGSSSGVGGGGHDADGGGLDASAYSGFHPDGVPDAGLARDAGDASGGGTPGDASDGGGSGGASGGGGAGGTGGSSGAGGGGGSGGSGGGSSVCSGDPVPLQVWSFDVDVEGWTRLNNSGASGTLSWSSGTGNPAPGALQFDATSGNGLIASILYSLGSDTNLSGRTPSAWVRLASGSSVSVNFIAATSLTTTAFGASVNLTPGVWTCVTFDPDAPESAPVGYDATRIRWIGLQPSGSAPFRIYVDQVAD